LKNPGKKLVAKLERFDAAEPIAMNKFGVVKYKNKAALKWHDKLNLWAWLFGPLYYFYQGLFAKGIALTGFILIIYGIMCSILLTFGIDAYSKSAPATGAIFAAYANIDIWKLHRNREIFWPAISYFRGARSVAILLFGFIALFLCEMQVEALKNNRSFSEEMTETFKTEPSQVDSTAMRKLFTADIDRLFRVEERESAVINAIGVANEKISKGQGDVYETVIIVRNAQASIDRMISGYLQYTPSNELPSDIQDSLSRIAKVMAQGSQRRKDGMVSYEKFLNDQRPSDLADMNSSFESYQAAGIQVGSMIGQLKTILGIN